MSEKSLLSKFGSFLTERKKESMFMNSVLSTPASFQYFSRMRTLGEIIPYYQDKLEAELAMTTAVKGLAREQAVEVARTLREEPGVGEVVDSDAYHRILDPDEVEDAG